MPLSYKANHAYVCRYIQKLSYKTPPSYVMDALDPYGPNKRSDYTQIWCQYTKENIEQRQKFQPIVRVNL